MDNQIEQTKDLLQYVSDQINIFVAQHFPDGLVLFFQILGKLLFLWLIIYVIDFILKTVINFFFRFYVDEKKYPVLKSIYKSRVTNSIAHLFALFIGSQALYSIFYLNRESFKFLERLIDFSLVVVLAGMAYRILKAFEYYYQLKGDHYRIVALKAISQTLKIFGIFIFSIIGIAVIFGISSSTILTSLGAITAVIVLVFRDTILGFVTGMHVATSRHLKAGDWIGIPKYNLEGTIEDIDLLTTKIMGFDKTVSTIPTYDLLSTEIKNLQVMTDTNTRRIKKSIVFNIKSFKFLDEELIDKLSEINLIRDYLEKKELEINLERKNLSHSEKMINGKQLTNIGTFRIYAYNYLKQNKNIDQNSVMMVRQLEITPNGLPLEIYCFANDSRWERFEQIQADIFDHLLVASQEFDLEVMQFTKI